LYVNQEDRDALSYKLTPLYPKDYDIIFIKVKESAVTTDKFRTLDKDNYSSVCFIGLVRDLPIVGLSQTSFIPKEEVQEFQNNGGRLTVQLSFEEEGYFKLCFKRPLDELRPDEVSVYDKFKELFSLMAYTEDGKKTYLQRKVYIGVDTRVGSGVLDGGRPLADQNKPTGTTPDANTTPGSQTLTTCSDPLGSSSSTSYTGPAAFKKYGFNRILLDWGSSVTYKTCDMGNYYCDQEQLYKSISIKQNKIKNNDYIQLGNIKFAKDATGAPEKLTTIDGYKQFKIDTNAQATSLATETELDKYISASNTILGAVPEGIKEITVMSVTSNNSTITAAEFTTFAQTIVPNSKVIGNKIYFNAATYVPIVNVSTPASKIKAKFPSMDDAKFNSYLQEFYVNMDVYYGVGLNNFVANLMKYGNLTSTENKAMMLTKTLYNNYDMILSTSSNLTNIVSPGAYYIKATSANDKITIEFSSNIIALNEFTGTGYSENPIFYKPINPTYNKFAD
ncbi:MAG: hypothetical protein WCF78_04980, partial [archaeon]